MIKLSRFSAVLSFGIASVASLLTASAASAATTFDAQFDAIVPDCDPAAFFVCDGVGTNTVNLGFPADENSFPISITFTPASYDTRPTGEFLLGNLTITNGTVFVDSLPSFGEPSGNFFTTFLNLNLAEITDGLVGTTDDLRIAYTSTLNVSDNLTAPINADKVYFPDFLELGEINILEGETINSATYNVGILATFGSIIPTGFQQIPNQTTGFVAPISPGFVDPDTGLFIIDGNSVEQSVPEPSLALAAAAVVGGFMFKRKRVSA